jgi:hypothetical protein
MGRLNAEKAVAKYLEPHVWLCVGFIEEGEGSPLLV